MDSILQGVPGTACYIDDIIVTGQTPEQHLKNLEAVLQRLLKHGVHVKKEKCRFLEPSVNFLGHRIDADGIHPTDEKLRAIVNAPAPKDVRSFLGFINYYGKFIPNAATILSTLNDLLRKDVEWKWTAQCQASFNLAKETLVSSKVLTHFDPSLPIRMAGDASAYGIGAVIAHVLPDGSERPIAFASRSLSSSEKNYAQVEKEALSLIFGVKRFHAYLYGRPFTLITDHKPLTAILGPKKGIPPLAAARLQRWSWILSAYQYTIEFRPTDKHANADGLSRLPLKETGREENDLASKIFNISQLEALPITVRHLRAATHSDILLSKVYRYTKRGWPQRVSQALRPFYERRSELTVEEGCLLRVLVPLKLRGKLLQELHADHPGVTRMKSVARSHMWWPGLDKAIEQMAKSCQSCQTVKGSPPVVPLHPWTWPSRPWQRVHLDFAGPFQGAMFLVAVDAYSKWPEVKILSKTTVAKTLNVLREWFAVHGVPEHLVTDNGPQFVAEEFELFAKQNGIKHTRSAPYHPASNGLAERFVKSMKQSLKVSENDGRSLLRRLSSYLLTYRTTSHSTTGVPPSQLLMGRDLRTRLTLLQPSCEKSVVEKQACQKASHDRRARHRKWIAGDRVMARNMRPGPAWIPGTIVEVLGPVTYVVETETGQQWKRHADQLKDWLPRDSPSTFDMDSESIDSNSGNPEVVDPEIDEPEDSPLDRHDTEPSDIDRLPGTESGSGNSDTHSPIEETGSADSGPVSPTDDMPDSRYPSRVRRAPRRYDPSDFGTFNFLVI